MGERTGELHERREREERKRMLPGGGERGRKREKKRRVCERKRGRGKEVKKEKEKRDGRAVQGREEEKEKKRRGKRERDMWLREMRGEDNAIISQPTTG